MLRFAYLGSPLFASDILEILIEKSYVPTVVVTQTPKSVGRGRESQSTAVGLLAKTKRIELIETPDINAHEVVTNLASKQLELIIVVAFGQILKETLLTMPKLCAINLHASLLPKYRGAAPIQWAIWNGESVTGVTVQRMVKKLDAGDILVQKEIPIARNDTSEDILKRMVPLGAAALLEGIGLIENGSSRWIVQDESKATFAPKLVKDHSEIDWSKEAVAIRNQIRATLPWPSCDILLSGNRVKLLESEIANGLGEPGVVYSDQKTYLHVQCGKGRLALTVIQPANRKPVNIADFLRGYRGDIPSRLNRNGAHS